MNKILVVIDMQVNFIRDYSAERIIPAVAKKIALRKEEGYEILLTVDKSGGELHEDILSVCLGQRQFKKHSYGCEQLIRYLKEVNAEVVEFVGICTDICVITNVLATMAFLPFSDIIVDSNSCASSTEGHAAALRVLKACNVSVI